MGRVEVNLPDIGNRAHQRTRKAATHAATGSRKRNVLCDRRLQNHVAWPFTREIDDRTLAGENAARRKRHSRRKAGAAGRFDAPIAWLYLVGRLNPTRCRRAVLRTPRGRRDWDRWRVRRHRLLAAASGRRRRRSRNSPGAQPVDQAGIDREPLAFDHHRVRRNLYVLPNRFNQSFADDHGSTVDHRAAHRHHLGIANRHRRGRLGRGASAKYCQR